MIYKKDFDKSIKKGEYFMLEVLEFIFRDFWTFCGVVILLYTIGAYCITAPIVAIASAFASTKEKKEKKNEEDW